MAYFSRMGPSLFFHASETSYLTSEWDKAHRLEMFGRDYVLFSLFLRECDISIGLRSNERITAHIQNKPEIIYCFWNKGSGVRMLYMALCKTLSFTFLAFRVVLEGKTYDRGMTSLYKSDSVPESNDSSLSSWLTLEVDKKGRSNNLC